MAVSTLIKEQTKTALTPAKQKAVVKWKGEVITITFQDVKNLICPLATDQEVAIFLKTCQSLQLNPFASECYLIKYDAKDKAAFVVAIDAYLKAAEVNKDYDGCEAGIILRNPSGTLELRDSAFILENERQMLVGGWAKVYRKDREHPTYVAINKNECIKLTRDGNPTQFWSEPKQPWMLRKTALKRALVEAFPSLFAGTLATAEIGGDIQDVEYHEDILPAALENNDGRPNFRKFWARVRAELKLGKDAARKLLGVQSVKKELIEQGYTLEQVWTMLVEKVKASRAPETQPELIEEEPLDLFDDAAVESPIDMVWLKESLESINWSDVGKWLREHYKEAMGTTIRQIVESLTRKHQEEFVKEVQKRLEAKTTK